MKDHQGNIVREEKQIKHRAWNSQTLHGQGGKEEPASEGGSWPLWGRKVRSAGARGNQGKNLHPGGGVMESVRQC